MGGATKTLWKMIAEYGNLFSEYWKPFHGVHRSDDCHDLCQRRRMKYFQNGALGFVCINFFHQLTLIYNVSSTSISLTLIRTMTMTMLGLRVFTPEVDLINSCHIGCVKHCRWYCVRHNDIYVHRQEWRGQPVARYGRVTRKGTISTWTAAATTLLLSFTKNSIFATHTLVELSIETGRKFQKHSSKTSTRGSYLPKKTRSAGS